MNKIYFFHPNKKKNISTIANATHPLKYFVFFFSANLKKKKIIIYQTSGLREFMIFLAALLNLSASFINRIVFNKFYST